MKKTEYERIRKVSAEFEAMAKTEKYHARSILVLPENETYGEFLEDARRNVGRLHTNRI